MSAARSTAELLALALSSRWLLVAEALLAPKSSDFSELTALQITHQARIRQRHNPGLAQPHGDFIESLLSLLTRELRSRNAVNRIGELEAELPTLSARLRAEIESEGLDPVAVCDQAVSETLIEGGQFCTRDTLLERLRKADGETGRAGG